MGKVFYLLFFFLVTDISVAQTGSDPRTSDLVWEYSVFVNQQTEYNQPGRLITHADHAVEWIQNGTNDNPFDTQGISGTWSDVSQNGSLVFNVTMGESLGTIEFKRAGGEILVTLNINNPGRKPAYIRFFIDNVTAL